MPHRTHGHSPALPPIAALALAGMLFALPLSAAPVRPSANQQHIERQRAVVRVQQGDLRALRDLSRARAEQRSGRSLASRGGGGHVVQGGGPPTALYVAFDDDRAVGEGYLAKFDASGLPGSGWPGFGLPVIAGAQVAFEHRSIDDGAGGRIVGWREYGIGPSRIRAQRINAAGVRLWGATGAMVSPDYDDGYLWEMIPDGAGGAFFAWEASAGTGDVVRAQHVNSAGAIAAGWPDTGVVLGGAGTVAGIPHLASDGLGGVYVTWSDINTELVYAQHLDGSASPQFSPAEGQPFSFVGHNHSVSADAAGGLTIAWQGAGFAGDDIFVERLDSGGTPTWGDSGVVVCDEASEQFNPQVQSDGSGGVLIGWFDRREDPLAIYALRLDSNGAPVTGWPDDGARVGSNDPSEFGWIPDGLGGGFFALSAFDFGTGLWSHALQHVLSDGGIAFGYGVDGQVVTTHAGSGPITMAPDGGGGVLAAWFEPDTYSGAAGLNLFGQHIDISGLGTWGGGNPLLLSLSAEGRQGLPSVVEGGSGGARVGFLQLNGAPTGLDAMFKRINQNGVPQGSTIPVAFGIEIVDAFSMVPDAPNRAIAVWGVASLSSHDIYAQRYSNQGASLWTPGGVTIATGSNVFGFGSPRIPAAPDGASGVIVGWSNTDVTLQRVDSTGTARWGASGTTAFTGADGSLLISDRDVQPAEGNGAFVNGTVFGSVTRWCVQKLDGDGNRLWGTNGYELVNDSLGSFSVSASAIVPDGTGGVYAAWQFGLFPGDQNRSIRVVRILSSGALAPGWPATGVEMRTGFTSGILAGLAPDGVGNAVATWMEFRGGRIGCYAQLINAGGSLVWNGPAPGDVINGTNSEGVALALDSGTQVLPQVDTDGVGGAVFTWLDGRGVSWDIYAQRIGAAGNSVWGTEGLGVCTDPEVQGRLALVSDGSSGALIAWADGRTRPADVIQIARVSGAGDLLWSSDGVVATLASLHSAQVVDGIARLTWYSSDPGFSARLERRTPSSDWQTLGDVRVDGAGWIRAEDATVERGARYGYRLVTSNAGIEQALDEVWLDVPTALEFALRGVRPNPANGPLTVSFVLPRNAPARLEVIDIAGRRVLSREVGFLGAGSHVLNLGEPSGLGSGLYFLRLTQGEDRREVRFSRVR